MHEIKLSQIDELNPNNAIQHLWQYASPMEAINSNKPTLKQVSECIDLEVAISFIASWLHIINKMVNVKRCLPPEGIDLLSLMILKFSGDLKLDEYALIILSIPKAEHGSLYQSLSSEYIFHAISEHERKKKSIQYAHEKEDEFVTRYDQQHFLGKNLMKLPLTMHFLKTGIKKVNI